MNCDEVTTINCQSWVNMHVFVVEGWKQIPFLLTLQQVVNGVSIKNLTKLIVDVLLHYGRLFELEMSSKSICFGVDGVIVF